MSQRFKFQHVNEITGTFVLAIASLLIGGLIWTSHSQRWFKSNVTLRIVLPEDGAAGIRQGSEVYFLGTRVGSVADVQVDTTGRMEARTSIRRDFFRFVRADSSAAVKKKFGVAGDSFFEITRGEGAPLPEQNASIVCNEQFQSALETAVEEVRNESMMVLKKLNAGLDTWTQLGADLTRTQKHVEQLAIRLDTMTAGVEQGRGTVGKLLTETALADEAQQLLLRAHETMAELRNVITNLNVAVTNVQHGTARLPEITDAVAKETQELPGLVIQTQTSMRELERLIVALQQHWIIRKYMDKTNAPASTPSRQGTEKKPVKSLMPSRR